MRIQDAEFKNSLLVERDKWVSLINNGHCQYWNFVCLSGQWNSVEILKSNLEGDRESQVSGIEVMHANIQTMNLMDVHISFMFSAMVFWSSDVGKFNVSGSIFLSNREGIDIGQGVRYMVVSRSQMNDTGSWFVQGEAVERCNSALKGRVQSLTVEGSVFAHNRAFGMTCNGAAIFLTDNVNDTPLLLANNETFEMGNRFIQTIVVENSVFHGNVLENCSTGGGAVTVYGMQLLITLKEKRELKRCPWGTILENGAFFVKKGTIFQNGAPRAPF